VCLINTIFFVNQNKKLATSFFGFAVRACLFLRRIHTKKKIHTPLMADFPLHSIGLIFGFLAAEDVRASREVCSAWKSNRAMWETMHIKDATDAQVAATMPLCERAFLREVSFTGSPHLTPATLVSILPLQKLENLGLAMCNRFVTDQTLPFVLACPTLRKLDLRYCTKFTDQGLMHVSKLPNLENLSLGWCFRITDAGLAHVAQLTTLTQLNLTNNSWLTDAGLAHVSELRNLTTLTFNECDAVTDAGLAHVAKIKNLQCLEIAECNGVSEAGFASLATLPNLVKLNAASLDLTDEACFHIARISTLQNLIIFSWERTTSAGFAQLATLVHLDELDVALTNITVDDLLKFKNVGKVDATCCANLNGHELSKLQQLHKLRGLVLNDCDWLTDACCEKLGQVQSLESLEISECQSVTNAGIAHLASLQKLKRLEMDNCRSLTDAALVHVAQMPSLKELCIRVSNFSDAGYALVAHMCEKGQMNLDKACR